MQMIAIPAGIIVVVVHEPVNFSFVNKRKNQARVIWYDGQGFSLCSKRLSSGTFSNWPRKTDGIFSTIEYFQAQGILSNSKSNIENYHPVWKETWITEALAKVKLDPAILAELLEVVEDHKSITDQVLAAIQRQEKSAKKLLEKLKEEALAHAKSKEANETAGNISTDKDYLNEGSSVDGETQKPDLPIDNIEQPKKNPALLKPRRVIKHPLNSDQLKCPCCSKNMHRAHKNQ